MHRSRKKLNVASLRTILQPGPPITLDCFLQCTSHRSPSRSANQRTYGMVLGEPHGGSQHGRHGRGGPRRPRGLVKKVHDGRAVPSRSSAPTPPLSPSRATPVPLKATESRWCDSRRLCKGVKRWPAAVWLVHMPAVLFFWMKMFRVRADGPVLDRRVQNAFVTFGRGEESRRL